MPTITENLKRVLTFHGLWDHLVITDEREDRVFAWPTDDVIRQYCQEHKWLRDPRGIAEQEHGTGESYREPGGVIPDMQICVHEAPAGSAWPYYLEIDLDHAAPDVTRPWTLLIHGEEVAENAITGHKTDQGVIAWLLDRRFGDVVA